MPTGTTPAAIVSAVLAALAAGRLPGGVRLREDRLAAHFAVSRTIVREALQELAFLGVVVSEPRRGASVAQSTSRDADELYAARIALESALMAELARNCTARDAKLLRAHLTRQVQASKGGLPGAVRLLGEFHMLLAELAGNRVMLRMLEQLVARTSLLVSIYGAEHCTCALEDHAMLIEELVAGRPAAASKVMSRHLLRNRGMLRIPDHGAHPRARSFDLEAALSGRAGGPVLVRPSLRPEG